MGIQKTAFEFGLLFANDKDQKRPQWRPTGWPPCFGECRSTHGSVVVRRCQDEEILVLLGGCATTTCFPFNSVVCFNVQSKKWQKGPCMHEKRARPASVLCNNAIYVIGGYNGRSAQDTIERIQVDDLLRSPSASSNGTNGWQTVDCRLRTPRFDCAAAVVHDRFIVVAGGRCHFLQDNLSSVEIIDTASGNACTIIPGPCLEVARRCFGMAVVGHRIYAVGGTSLRSVEYMDFDDLLDDSPSCTTSVFSVSKSWKRHNSVFLSSRRKTHVAVVQVGSCLVVAGGYFAGTKLSLEIFDTVNNSSWELLNMIELRFGCSIVALSNGIVAMNGYGSSDSFETLSLVDKNSWLFTRLLSIGKIPSK